MIHYHGGPITPETAAIRIWRGRHAFVSFADDRQIGAAASVCQTFALDNGAFSAWRGGKPVTDWRPFYAWVDQWRRHPGFDFAVIPDVIDGDEAANDALAAEWPHARHEAAIVWHMHETIDRLRRLAAEWPRVAIGSSGDFAVVGNARWWRRMNEAMKAICDEAGRPLCKLHGLRMLNPEVFSRLPFASADSTNVAQNIGIDSAWNGTYQPASKETRAIVMAERIEVFNGAEQWSPQMAQSEWEFAA